jgi:hypothetical protein
MLPEGYNYYPIIGVVMAGFGGYLLLNFGLAEYASRTVGGYWKWVFGFTFLPIIFHILFIILLVYWFHKVRGLKVLQAVVSDRRDMSALFDESPQLEGSEASVTPFGSTDEPDENTALSELAKIEDELSILGEKRDARLDELIQWEEYDKAYQLAEEWLSLEEKKQHDTYIKVYKAYKQILAPHVHSGVHIEEPD